MSATAQTLDRRAAAVVVAVLLAIAPSACKQAEAVEVEHYQPSKVTPADDGGHPTVTLTQLGADQIRLETAAVEAASKRKRLPYAAVLYDAAGQPYVFENVAGLSFHRSDITINRIDGDTVFFSDGPAVGGRVVTTGNAQVHGAELEFGAY